MLDVQYENDYANLSKGLSLVATHYCKVEVKAQEDQLDEPCAKPVVVTVPSDTEFVDVSVIGVQMQFQDEYMEERPLAKFYFEIQRGKIEGNKFKFVILADLRDQRATTTWAAVFRIQLTYFK